MNYGTAQWISYDLSNYTNVGGPVTRWITATGTGDKYHLYNDTVVTGKTFRAWFPTNSIQTFEIQNVVTEFPRLDLTLTTNELALLWPGWASNYTVWSATNLASPNGWSPVTNAVQSTNSQWKLALPDITNEARFYRLQAP
jgi:hypothetical protein